MKERKANFIKTMIVISIALLSGVIIIIFISETPIEALKSFFLAPFSGKYYIGNLLAGAVPLIFTGLAVAVAFSASTYNLGVEGQVYIGSLIGTYILLKLPGTPSVPGIILAVGIAFITGGLIAGISGLLKVYKNTNELISSLLLSYAAIPFVDYLVEGPLNDAPSGLAASPYISEKFMLPWLMKPSSLHLGFPLAIVMVYFVHLFLNRTKAGYQLKITGKNMKFAEYIGIETGKIWLLSMALSGGLAAMGGIFDVLGVQGRVIRGFSTGYGWNGIAVALIARNNPFLVVPAAIFFSYLEISSQIASFEADLTPEIARIVQAVIFYLITAEGLFSFFVRRKKK